MEGFCIRRDVGRGEPSPRPAGRSLRETWPSGTAGAEVKRGGAPRAPPRSLRETWPSATAGAEVRRGEGRPLSLPRPGEGVLEASLRDTTDFRTFRRVSTY